MKKLVIIELVVIVLLFAIFFSVMALRSRESNMQDYVPEGKTDINKVVNLYR